MSGHSGQVQIVNWYQMVIEAFADHDIAARWWSVGSSLAGFLFIVVLGVLSGLYRLRPERMSDEELLPPTKFGVRAFVELCWSVVSSTLTSVIGEKHWKTFAPLLGGTFFYILLINLSGVVPGFAPATEQMNLTLAMGLIIFASFNYYGLKFAGVNYLKHLLGPLSLPIPLLIILPPLMLMIEVVGTCARPVSLGLRLFGNVSGDHLVFSVFSTLQKSVGIPWFPLPVALLAFGLLVACLQAFIFMTLSAVYIKLAIETAHHTEEHH
jgi:F-type H+-transporting ATPase subunit a